MGSCFFKINFILFILFIFHLYTFLLQCLGSFHKTIFDFSFLWYNLKKNFCFSGGASTNPTANSKLAAALELAKKNNMPKASVDKVISKSQVRRYW